MAEHPNLFAVVSWGCAATHWLARALDAHPEIFCMHAGNLAWQQHGGAPYLDGPEYLRVVRALGSSYAAAGDVHGVGLQTLSTAHKIFGSRFGSAILVREPIARLHSQFSLFRLYAHSHAWKIEYVQRYIDAGITLPDDAYETRLVLHGIAMLNKIEVEREFAKVWRSEDLTKRPDALTEFVTDITRGAVAAESQWAEAVITAPPVYQHATGYRPASADTPRVLTDWQIDAIRKIVTPRAWELYSELGYPIPDFVQ